MSDLNTLPSEVSEALPSGPVMLVDRAKIQWNFRHLASLTKGTCAAIVKGDAYGHGMIPSALALKDAGAELFFTARVCDAFALRDAIGTGPRIAVLDGVPENFLADAARQGIIPVINTESQLRHLAQQVGRPRAFVHIDTAMNRLGLDVARMNTFTPLIGMLDVQAYMTHFASADDIDMELCRDQVRRLSDAVAGLPAAPLSIANSSGVFLGEEFHGTITRPGKSTFGINPLAEGANPMEEPAIVLAPIVQIRDLRKGAAVGYSETWRAPETRRIAIIAIGYANGYLRASSSRASVALAGQTIPVIGRVSMDLTAIDVTGLPDYLVREGALVEIVGPTISYRKLASAAGTNEHEALIGLGRGCRRFHL